MRGRGSELFQTNTERRKKKKKKMAARLLLLLLLNLGALLLTSEAREAYSELPGSYQRGVDLALEQLGAHAGIQHHFLYFRSILKSDIEVSRPTAER